MFDDVTKSIKALLYERVTNPLSGAFIFFWFIFNWQGILYLILDKKSILERLEFFNENYIFYDVTLICPFSFALLFISIYPLVSFFPYKYWQWADSKKRMVKLNYELSVPITLEESIEIKNYSKILEKKYKESLAESNNNLLLKEKDVQRLKDENIKLNELLKKYTKVEEHEHNLKPKEGPSPMIQTMKINGLSPSYLERIAKSDPTILVGDMVQLKSGGPRMTVSLINDQEIKCSWFDSNNTYLQGSFSLIELNKV